MRGAETEADGGEGKMQCAMCVLPSCRSLSSTLSTFERTHDTTSTILRLAHECNCKHALYGAIVPLFRFVYYFIALFILPFYFAVHALLFSLFSAAAAAGARRLFEARRTAAGAQTKQKSNLYRCGGKKRQHR